MTTQTIRVPEILAPAGGRQQFFAALNSGADAVFLGLGVFNARARAENFSEADLAELVPLAHRYGMKVLVTLNILIKEAELPELIRILSVLESLEIDAVIVQDLGVASIVRDHFPNLSIHASTQMAVHNLAGVLIAQELGFKRVVLAREITSAELKRIRAALPDDGIELEVFCHGSLCYSYSGLCFFSGAEDSRSGNRGECAYTCRKPYKILSEPGHGFLFSMRDLNTAENLNLLVQAGVDTLKIEGRKKDAQYVASVVTLYRKKLDELFGYSTLRKTAPSEAFKYFSDTKESVTSDLALSYQRRPTSLFLKTRYHENVIDLDNPTHRGIEVGRILQVKNREIKVKAHVPLERFDGLRIIKDQLTYHASPQQESGSKKDHESMKSRYTNSEAEFSLRDFKVQGVKSFVAGVGDDVVFELPPELPLPKAGDVLFKIRSADLKRRITAISSAPHDARIRSLLPIHVELESIVCEQDLVITARALKFGKILASSQIQLAFEPIRSGDRLDSITQELFAVFGDQGFYSRSFKFLGEAQAFIPKSKLKSLKKSLADGIELDYKNFIKTRMEKALVYPVRDDRKIVETKRSLRVKLDRLSTLKAVVEWHNSRPASPITEVVFEPKRSLTSGLTPEDLATQLTAICAKSGLKLRLALPTVLRAWDEPLTKQYFRHAANLGVSAFEVGNLGGLEILKGWGVETNDVAADFTLYTLNSKAMRFWQDQGLKHISLSIEDDKTNISNMVNALNRDEVSSLSVILYKDTPLFIAESCSLTALHNGCPTSKVCGYRSLTIENDKGERFHVAHESCKSIVYGEDAYAITARLSYLASLGIHDFRIDFLTREYSDARVMQVLESATNGMPLSGTFEANFSRELL